MGTVFVDNLEPQSGTTLTLGASGDAINLASGATAGFGKIGQVVTNVYTTTGATTNSSSFTQIGPSLSITPTSTSSKILLFLNGGSLYTESDRNAQVTIYRGSTDLGNTQGFMNHFANASYLQGPISINFVDSPSTISATTYAMYVKTTTTASNVSVQDSPTKTVLTAMEILA